MKSPITWRNVNAPSNTASNELMVAGGQTIMNGLNKLQQVAQGYADNREDNLNALKQYHTDAYLARANDINTMEDYDRALKAGIFSRENIMQETGGMADWKQIHERFTQRDNEIRTDVNERYTFNQNQQTRADKPILAQYTTALAGVNRDNEQAFNEETDQLLYQVRTDPNLSESARAEFILKVEAGRQGAINGIRDEVNYQQGVYANKTINDLLANNRTSRDYNTQQLQIIADQIDGVEVENGQLVYPKAPNPADNKYVGFEALYQEDLNKYKQAVITTDKLLKETELLRTRTAGEQAQDLRVLLRDADLDATEIATAEKTLRLIQDQQGYLTVDGQNTLKAQTAGIELEYTKALAEEQAKLDEVLAQNPTNAILTVREGYDEMADLNQFLLEQFPDGKMFWGMGGHELVKETTKYVENGIVAKDSKTMLKVEPWMIKLAVSGSSDPNGNKLLGFIGEDAHVNTSTFEDRLRAVASDKTNAERYAAVKKAQSDFRAQKASLDKKKLIDITAATKQVYRENGAVDYSYYNNLLTTGAAKYKRN